MCGQCSQLCLAYATLKSNLGIVCEKVDECKGLNGNAFRNFIMVQIDGSPIDKGKLHDSLKSLNEIKNKLQILMGECDQKIAEIKAACPGPSHYEDLEKYASK